MTKRGICGWVGLAAVAAGVCGGVLSSMAAGAQAPPVAADALQVYLIDVEGGQATLFVTPDHHALLIDTGWPGNNGRDAERIVSAAHEAGVQQIDDLLITHFHTDHVGGVPQLLARMPVGTVIDHGVNREESDQATHAVYVAYGQALAAPHAPKHVVAQVGQSFSLGALRWEVVSADGVVLQQPLTGANGAAGAANAGNCAKTEVRAVDATENARSVGVVLYWGKAKLVDLGDLSWNKERELMCPINRLGQADVYIVSHHGWDQSGSPALVNGLAPRLALMDNGGKKGGSPAPWQVIQDSPRLQDQWQLHYAEGSGADHNVPNERIANLQGGADGAYLRLTVDPKGSLAVYNARTHATQSYPAP